MIVSLFHTNANLGQIRQMVEAIGPGSQIKDIDITINFSKAYSNNKIMNQIVLTMEDMLQDRQGNEPM